MNFKTRIVTKQVEETYEVFDLKDEFDQRVLYLELYGSGHFFDPNVSRMRQEMKVKQA